MSCSSGRLSVVCGAVSALCGPIVVPGVLEKTWRGFEEGTVAVGEGGGSWDGVVLLGVVVLGKDWYGSVGGNGFVCMGELVRSKRVGGYGVKCVGKVVVVVWVGVGGRGVWLYLCYFRGRCR
ncbi:hypothetical protein E2C01_057630 [Portunus trituberculatus]|uniref:Uncharacterized protein n=1 Tax=Portunus trituberculatus TaxID=210409 RepID=A0A5B7GTG7_PORTR|nr:hypothetical protein [Portunus trituberculatus]